MMDNVARVREVVIRTQRYALARLRYLLTDTNEKDRVTGVDIASFDQYAAKADDGTMLARVVELIMTELGHETEIKVADSNGHHRSQTERAVRRSVGAGSGKARRSERLAKKRAARGRAFGELVRAETETSSAPEQPLAVATE